MRRRWYKFRALFAKRRAAAGPVLLELPKPAPWTADDVTEFRRFLGTVTGQRLLARARCLEYRNALAGCNDSITTSHSAGRGAGFSDAINWLESLSRVTGDQVTGAEPANSNDSRPPDSEPDPAELLSL